MKKFFVISLLLCLSFSSFSQWASVTAWFDQAVKDVSLATKEVEDSYNLVNKQVQASTQQFVNEVENFTIDFTKSMNTIGDDCNRVSADVYSSVESSVESEVKNLGSSGLSKPSNAICKRCIKTATLQFICRLPETIQGNMAFMDKMNSMMDDPRVTKVPDPGKPIAAIAVSTTDDFIDEFTYYFNLLNEFRNSIDVSQLSITEQQLVELIFSDPNCEALADQAFDSMLGAVKSKAERQKAQKRYAALLKMIKGYENMETVSGWNDQLNRVSSFFPESKAQNNIPSANPLYDVGGAENIFVNATGNGLWVDARNWSKQMVPLPYQVAYIPKGKTAIVDRPISVKAIIDNNLNNSGMDIRSTITFTDVADYYDGHTFAIQAKHSGLYFAVNNDSKVNGGSIIQWNNPSHGSHHFQLRSTGDGDGSYFIISKWSGLRLDVFGPSNDNGANLGQWQNHQMDNQKFYFEDAGGGYYLIRSKYSGKVIDVSGCQRAKGTNIQQWEEVPGADCQMFRLVPKTLSGRTFFIETKMSNKVLDMTQDSYYGPAIHLWEKHGGFNQKFLFQLAEVDENGNEWYYLIVRDGNKYLIPAGYGVTNGTRILAGDSHFNDWATMFRLEKFDDNYFYIQSRFGKEVNGKWTGMRNFDLSGCENNNGTVLQLYDKVAGADCQLFKLVEVN
ncbi:RICIN domain-containing protein [Ekhidna sp.]|uniref:RICIN domain-containing protein n=1 Tax=Ekhidna sp. TaxID=2608089 RepID=UPI003B514551